MKTNGGYEKVTISTSIFTIMFLALMFFLSGHDLDYSYVEDMSRSSDFFETITVDGDSQRRVAILALGLYGVIGIIRKRTYGVKIDKIQKILFVLFVLWSLMSLLWSIDASITFRRLVVFFIFCSTAYFMAMNFPIKYFAFCLFGITTIYLCLGISVEFLSGSLRPWMSGYRFAGTIHPNQQALNCAMMFLTACCLAKITKGRKCWYMLAAFVALIFLILTKSRTSFGCLILSQTVFIVINSSKARSSGKVLAALGIVLGVGFLYLFGGEGLISTGLQGLLLGREWEDIATLTGRTQIWGACFEYIGMRPWHGYGFNSFWVPAHIDEFSDIVGIGIVQAHSVYIDLLLGLGVVGLVLYVLIVLVGMYNAFRRFKQTQEEIFGFVVALLVMFISHGFLESTIIQVSSVATFVMIWSILIVCKGKI